MTLTLVVETERETQALAALLAEYAQAGDVFFLKGGLGAGKSTFARGFITALGHDGVVKSPTYALVESYSLHRCLVYHFDLYRLRDVDELYALGIDDYFVNDAICLLEWPERAHQALPEADLVITLNTVAPTTRRLELQANGARGQWLLQRLRLNKGYIVCDSGFDV